MTEARTRRLAAVWFADIVGYTALSTRDEDAAMAVVDEFQRLSRAAVGDKGRVVKFLGDGALSVFDSTDRALESALALRDAFAASEVARRHGCTLSVGVHMGEVIQAEDGDVYGDGVNFAARVEGVAETNQVIVSEDVYRLIRNRPGYHPQSIGEHSLKGVEKPALLYVLARPGETVRAPQALAAAVGTVASDRSHRKAVAIGTLAGVAGFVMLSFFVAWSVDFPEEQGADGAGGPASELPVAETPEPTVVDRAAPTAQGTPRQRTDRPSADRPNARSGTAQGTRPTPAVDPAAANRLLVLVFGEGPAAAAEAPILRSLGNVAGVSTVEGPGAALLRRNPEVARGALQGDLSSLAELARRQGIEYIVLGDFESTAAQARGAMYTGSARLGLRMYRVSTGEIVDSGVFAVGGGDGEAIGGANELAARTQAAQAVGREGAVAARRWLLVSLRN